MNLKNIRLKLLPLHYFDRAYPQNRDNKGAPSSPKTYTDTSSKRQRCPLPGQRDYRNRD